MKKKLSYLLTGVGALIITSFLISSCNDEKNARMEVRLTDAPGDYQEVNIDIQDVQIHSSSGDQEGGWMSLNVTPGVYNLLQLTNGLDTLLGSMELPAGKVSQIRLVLGENNTVVLNDETHDLTTPSSQQSGLKLNLHANLQEGVTYKLLLDFDVAKSIVKNGNKYILKPVIRTVSEATSGAIKGSVSIVESRPAVFAIDGLDTLTTSYADSTGHFLLRGLPAGTYTVSFSPATGYLIDDVTSVPVSVGNVTNLGVVEVVAE